MSVLGILNEKNRHELTDIGLAIVGSLIFAAGVNVFIIPLGLYNGGFLGIAQLIRTFLVSVSHSSLLSKVDIAGIIYFFINIPLFIMGLRILGKRFTVKTLGSVALQSIFMTIIPIPAAPLISDYLTGCIIGGVIAGIGCGLVLRGHSSGGGQDIVGMCCVKKYPNLSVGQFSLIMNLFIYGVCLFLFNIEIVIYSVIYSMALSLAVDRIHIQNINTSALIFTKKTGIAKEIMAETGRGVTTWEGEGAYTGEASHILYVMLSKYEVSHIKHIVKNIDPHAFMILTEGCRVEGNFEKRL